MTELALLAQEVGANERTLRRALEQGSLRGTRPTPRTLDLPLSERLYIRRLWPLLAKLRGALRTEQNVRFALLFGSAATGEDEPTSDVDLLVELRDPGLERVVALSEKLSEVVGRPVDPVRLEDAESTPAFLADVLAEGRVLVDRDNRWPALRRSEPRLRRRGRRREAERLGAGLARIDEMLAS